MQKKALWVCVVGAGLCSLYCGHLLAQDYGLPTPDYFVGLEDTGDRETESPDNSSRVGTTAQAAGGKRVLTTAQAAGGKRPIRGRRRRRRPMLWFHIHKSAGTFMCRLANKAGERIVKPGYCCNWEPYDSYSARGQWPERQISCDKRLQYFHKHNFTWGGIERDLWPSDHCWDQFLYGTLLRSPLDYVRSTLNYYVHFEKKGDRDQILEDLRRRLQHREPRRIQAKYPVERGSGRGPAKAIAAKGAQNKKPGQSQRRKRARRKQTRTERGSGRGPAEAIAAKGAQKRARRNQEIWRNLDNYQTRVLAGALEVPAGGINATHLAAARRELERFVVVAKVEDLKRPGFVEQLMRRVGWTVSEKLLGYAATPQFSSKDLHTNVINFTAAEQAWLLEVNSMDLALWSELEST